MKRFLFHSAESQCSHLIVRCALFVLVVLSMQIILKAQGSSFQPIFERLTTQQGLPHNNVSNIIQDSYGFIWLATKNGLCRYDGYNFMLFQHNRDTTTTYLSNNLIMDLCLDSNKSLWVGTFAGGVNRIDVRTGKTTVFSKQSSGDRSIGDNKIISIICDTKGTVWVGTWSGISEFNSAKQTFTNYELPIASRINHVVTLYDDNKGVIWVATEVAVYHFNKYTKTWSLWKPLTTVHVFKQDRDECLWIGGTFGVKRYNFQTQEMVSYSESIQSFLPTNEKAMVIDVEIDNQGYLWFGTMNHGVFRCHYSDKQYKWEWFAHIQDKQKSLSHNNIRDLFCDNEGIMWIGTRGGGVNKHFPLRNMFTFYESQSNKEILFDLLTSLQIDRQNTVLIGARNGIFTVNTVYGYLDILSRYHRAIIGQMPIILGVYFDNSHRLWVATRNGCYLIDTSNTKGKAFFYNKNKDPQHLITKQKFDFLWADTLVPTMQIASVVQDKFGYIWFGTRGGGIYRLDSTFRNIKIYRSNYDKLDENKDLINVLFKDRNENIWAGTDDGLLLFDRQKDNFKVFQHQPETENSLSNNKVQTIFEDNKGLLWVGTYYGLNVFNPHTSRWQRFFSSDGLSSDIVNGTIGETSTSNVLWISTEFGLNRLAVTYDTARGDLMPVKCTCSIFSHQNGLEYAEFIPNGVCRGQDGYLYFAQYNGILQVDTRAFFSSRNNTPPQVFLTSFKKFGTPVKSDILHFNTQPFEIEEKDNVISFEFVALNYFSSSSNRYSYCLEGFDKDWSAPSNQRQVVYTNLHPGTYTFKIKATNNDGVWNRQELAFVIIVHPPWWKTSWSYLLYSIVGMMGLVVFIRYRERVQSKTLREQYQKREADIIFQKNQVLEEANNRLVLLNAELHGVNEQLHVVNTEKTDIVNLVVHDLKNPVIGIQKLAYSLEALGRKSAQDQIEQSGAVIKHTAERMYSLIQQLLRVHAVEHDKNTMSCIALDVQEITEQYVGDWSLRQQQPIRIQIQYPSSPPPYIAYADPLAFLQILENLISNAAKVTAPNGVILVSIEHQIIEHPAIEYKTTMLSVSVRDFGVGIEKDQQDRLFTKFSSIKKKSFDSSSSGLGLYIVKKLVEAMNGSLSFESVPGEGTVFTVLLPTISE